MLLQAMSRDRSVRNNLGLQYLGITSVFLKFRLRKFLTLHPSTTAALRTRFQQHPTGGACSFMMTPTPPAGQVETLFLAEQTSFCAFYFCVFPVYRLALSKTRRFPSHSHEFKFVPISTPKICQDHPTRVAVSERKPGRVCVFLWETYRHFVTISQYYTLHKYYDFFASVSLRNNIMIFPA
jgi:hypothetical protein